MCLQPNSLARSVKSSDSNWVPWSVVITLGLPYHDIYVERERCQQRIPRIDRLLAWLPANEKTYLTWLNNIDNPERVEAVRQRAGGLAGTSYREH